MNETSNLLNGLLTIKSDDTTFFYKLNENDQAYIVSFSTIKNEIFLPKSLDGHNVIGINERPVTSSPNLTKIHVPTDYEQSSSIVRGNHLDNYKDYNSFSNNGRWDVPDANMEMNIYQATRRINDMSGLNLEKDDLLFILAYKDLHKGGMDQISYTRNAAGEIMLSGDSLRIIIAEYDDFINFAKDNFKEKEVDELAEDEEDLSRERDNDEEQLEENTETASEHDDSTNDEFLFDDIIEDESKKEKKKKKQKKHKETSYVTTEEKLYDVINENETQKEQVDDYAKQEYEKRLFESAAIDFKTVNEPAMPFSDSKYQDFNESQQDAFSEAYSRKEEAHAQIEEEIRKLEELNNNFKDKHDIDTSDSLFKYDQKPIENVTSELLEYGERREMEFTKEDNGYTFVSDKKQPEIEERYDTQKRGFDFSSIDGSTERNNYDEDAYKEKIDETNSSIERYNEEKRREQNFQKDNNVSAYSDINKNSEASIIESARNEASKIDNKETFRENQKEFDKDVLEFQRERETILENIRKYSEAEKQADSDLFVIARRDLQHEQQLQGVLSDNNSEVANYYRSRMDTFDLSAKNDLIRDLDVQDRVTKLFLESANIDVKSAAKAAEFKYTLSCYEAIEYYDSQKGIEGTAYNEVGVKNRLTAVQSTAKEEIVKIAADRLSSVIKYLDELQKTRDSLLELEKQLKLKSPEYRYSKDSDFFQNCVDDCTDKKLKNTVGHYFAVSEMIQDTKKRLNERFNIDVGGNFDGVIQSSQRDLIDTSADIATTGRFAPAINDIIVATIQRENAAASIEKIRKNFNNRVYNVDSLDETQRMLVRQLENMLDSHKQIEKTFIENSNLSTIEKKDKLNKLEDNYRNKRMAINDTAYKMLQMANDKSCYNQQMTSWMVDNDKISDNKSDNAVKTQSDNMVAGVGKVYWRNYESKERTALKLSRLANKSWNDLRQFVMSDTDLDTGVRSLSNGVGMSASLIGLIATKSYAKSTTSSSLNDLLGDFGLRRADATSLFTNISKITGKNVSQIDMADINAFMSHRVKNMNGKNFNLSQLSPKRLRAIANNVGLTNEERAAAVYVLSKRNQTRAQRSLDRNRMKVKMLRKRFMYFSLGGSDGMSGLHTAMQMYDTVSRSIGVACRMVRRTSELMAWSAKRQLARVERKIASKGETERLLKKRAKRKKTWQRRTSISDRISTIRQRIQDRKRQAMRSATDKGRKIAGKAANKLVNSRAGVRASRIANRINDAGRRAGSRIARTKVGKAAAKTGKFAAKTGKFAGKIGSKIAQFSGKIFEKIGSLATGFGELKLWAGLILIGIFLALILLSVIGQGAIAILFSLGSDIEVKFLGNNSDIKYTVTPEEYAYRYLYYDNELKAYNLDTSWLLCGLDPEEDPPLDNIWYAGLENISNNVTISDVLGKDLSNGNISGYLGYPDPTNGFERPTINGFGSPDDSVLAQEVFFYDSDGTEMNPVGIYSGNIGNPAYKYMSNAKTLLSVLDVKLSYGGPPADNGSGGAYDVGSLGIDWGKYPSTYIDYLDDIYAATHFYTLSVGKSLNTPDKQTEEGRTNSDIDGRSLQSYNNGGYLYTCKNGDGTKKWFCSDYSSNQGLGHSVIIDTGKKDVVPDNVFVKKDESKYNDYHDAYGCVPQNDINRLLKDGDYTIAYCDGCQWAYQETLRTQDVIKEKLDNDEITIEKAKWVKDANNNYVKYCPGHICKASLLSKYKPDEFGRYKSKDIIKSKPNNALREGTYWPASAVSDLSWALRGSLIDPNTVLGSAGIEGKEKVDCYYTDKVQTPTETTVFNDVKGMLNKTNGIEYKDYSFTLLGNTISLGKGYTLNINLASKTDQGNTKFYKFKYDNGDDAFTAVYTYSNGFLTSIDLFPTQMYHSVKTGFESNVLDTTLIKDEDGFDEAGMTMAYIAQQYVNKNGGNNIMSYFEIPVFVGAVSYKAKLYIPISFYDGTTEHNETFTHKIKVPCGRYAYCSGHKAHFCTGHAKLIVDTFTSHATDYINNPYKTWISNNPGNAFWSVYTHNSTEMNMYMNLEKYAEDKTITLFGKEIARWDAQDKINWFDGDTEFNTYQYLVLKHTAMDHNTSSDWRAWCTLWRYKNAVNGSLEPDYTMSSDLLYSEGQKSNIIDGTKEVSGAASPVDITRRRIINSLSSGGSVFPVAGPGDDPDTTQQFTYFREFVPCGNSILYTAMINQANGLTTNILNDQCYTNGKRIYMIGETFDVSLTYHKELGTTLSMLDVPYFVNNRLIGSKTYSALSDRYQRWGSVYSNSVAGSDSKLAGNFIHFDKNKFKKYAGM